MHLVFSQVDQLHHVDAADGHRLVEAFSGATVDEGLFAENRCSGADLAIGSRVLGTMERGALSLPQIVGNRVAGLLIRALWSSRVTDLGPFRAMRLDALRRLEMRDTAYGWTVEMQIKAIQSGMRLVETPVNTRRRRFGTSKVGGTVKGVVGASVGILSTILKLWIRHGRSEAPSRGARGRRGTGGQDC